MIPRTWEYDPDDEIPVTPRLSTFSLNSDLPADLLRAVPLHTCLAGFGRHWRSSSKGRWELRESTEKIDSFLSHDWGTGNFGKYIALLLIFNAVPSALVAVMVTIITCWLLSIESLPGGWPTATILIYASFLVTLFFKQDFQRLLCCRPQKVFLDKLCISQQDEQLKKQGIQGLGGFLNKSNELIILWSPKTFSRLWCTFELACFVRKSDKTINFVPVSMAKLLWLAGLNNLCLWLLWLLWVTFESEGTLGSQQGDVEGFTLAVGIVSPVVLAGIVAETYFGIAQSGCHQCFFCFYLTMVL